MESQIISVNLFFAEIAETSLHEETCRTLVCPTHRRVPSPIMIHFWREGIDLIEELTGKFITTKLIYEETTVRALWPFKERAGSRHSSWLLARVGAP